MFLDKPNPLMVFMLYLVFQFILFLTHFHYGQFDFLKFHLDLKHNELEILLQLLIIF